MVCKTCGREAKDWCPGCKALSRIRVLWENYLKGPGEAEGLTTLRICSSELQDIVDGVHLAPRSADPSSGVPTAPGTGSSGPTPEVAEAEKATPKTEVKTEEPPVTSGGEAKAETASSEEEEEEEEPPEVDREITEEKAAPAEDSLGLTSIGAVLSAPTPESCSHEKGKREKTAPASGDERRRDTRRREEPNVTEEGRELPVREDPDLLKDPHLGGSQEGTGRDRGGRTRTKVRRRGNEVVSGELPITPRKITNGAESKDEGKGQASSGKVEETCRIGETCSSSGLEKPMDARNGGKAQRGGPWRPEDGSGDSGDRGCLLWGDDSALRPGEEDRGGGSGTPPISPPPGDFSGVHPTRPFTGSQLGLHGSPMLGLLQSNGNGRPVCSRKEGSAWC